MKITYPKNAEYAYEIVLKFCKTRGIPPIIKGIPKVVINILIEELAFLIEYSALLARTKKIFNNMIGFIHQIYIFESVVSK